MQANEFYNQHKVELIIAGLGLLFIGIGIYGYLKPVLFPPSLVILGNNTSQKELMVDISGAVNKPGVYKLVTGDRIQNLLDKAGGLTDKYDTKWVETNLNRAKKVSDGEKVYIPRIGESNTQSSVLSAQNKLININAATKSELEAIAGICPSTAEKIINGRPYQDLTDLVTKKIISAKLYTQIKDQLSVW